jgi:hypothetical protein
MALIARGLFQYSIHVAMMRPFCEVDRLIGVVLYESAYFLQIGGP